MNLRAVLRLWRWVLNVRCQEPYCNQRRNCWRWHVELFDCPTCGRTYSEFDPERDRVVEAITSRSPAALVVGPSATWGSGVTITDCTWSRP